MANEDIDAMDDELADDYEEGEEGEEEAEEKGRGGGDPG